MSMYKNNFLSVNERTLLPLLWGISAVALGLVLMLAPVERADAQGKAERESSYITTIREIFDFIQKHYVDEVEPAVLYEGAMKGLFDSLGDPHSNYLSQRDMIDMADTTSGEFGGVGLYISKATDPKEGEQAFVEVAAPIENTPGWRAGIMTGDLIIAINNESTDALTMDQVLERLRGKPGTDVTIMIRRGKEIEFPVTLTREIIEVPTVKHAMIGNTGYLKLLTFTPMTDPRAREALKEFQAAGYTSLILDLRNNYGGLLDSATRICDLFFDGGVVVSTKSRLPGENKEFRASRGVVVPANMPVIVLINRASASASEIVAGALKDRGRAYLVGEKSYGKGSVQQVFPLPDADGFKLTVARYYTPSDVNIDIVGIPPDMEVLTPEFAETDVESLKKLLEGKEIPDYVKAHPTMTSAEIRIYAAELSKKYKLDAELLRILVRNEQTRIGDAPVYDLEYDVQLQKAIDILKSNEYRQLMQSTKTLKQLQEETEQKTTVTVS